MASSWQHTRLAAIEKKESHTVGASGAGWAGTSRAGTGSGRGSSRGRTITADKGSLAAGEEAVDASVDALGVGLGGGGRSIALVALGRALVGRDGLGRVGASVAQAGGLAVDIASIARHGAAHGRRETRCGGLGDGGAGDGATALGGGGGSEEEDGRVLHYGVEECVCVGGRVARISTSRAMKRLASV